MAENINQEQTQNPAFVQMDAKFTEVMDNWTAVVKELSNKLKNIGDVQNLLSEVYIKRQECTEYIQKLWISVGEYNRTLKQKSAKRYNEYKFQSQIRYTSDAAINNQIEVEFENYHRIIDMLNTHAKMMQEVLKTIDDIIFGISTRVKIHEMINGLKF